MKLNFYAAVGAAALTLSLSSTLNAQQKKCKDTIKVLLTEAGSKAPIPAALIRLGDQAVQTDMQGVGSFSNICPGSVQLVIDAMGYKNVDTTLQVSGSDFLQFQLGKSAISLDAIEVTGHKQPLSTTASVATIQKKELDKVAGGSLAEAVQSISGVRMLQTGATVAKPVINGMHSNRIVILNNGIRQEGQQWGAEHAPEIDPFMAQSISVVKGAEAIRYGAQAIGGVVLVTPPPLPTDSAVHGTVNLVGASNGKMGVVSAMLNGNFKKMPAWSWRVQGTAKRSGNYRTADYFLNNTGAKEYSYSAAVGYQKAHFDATFFYSHFENNLGIFKGAEIGSIDDLRKRIAYGRPYVDGGFDYAIKPPSQRIKHDLLKLKAHVHFNDYLHLTALYGWQTDHRQEYDIRLGGRSVLPVMDLKLATQSLDVSLDYFNGLHWKGTLGVSGVYENNRNIPGTFTTPLIPDYISQNVGAFLLLSRIMNKIQLEAGFRYDYKGLDARGYDRDQNLYGGLHNFHNVSGSLGAIWAISPSLNLNTNLGTAWRSPTVNELYSNGLHDGAASFEKGDPGLKTEQSLKWITTMKYNGLSGRLHVDLDVYGQWFDGYIYLSPADSLYESLRGVFPVFRYEQTNARFLGADLTARLEFLKQFEYVLKGSAIRARDVSQNRFLPFIPADQLVQSIEWNKNPTPFFKDSYLKLTHTWVARQQRYEPESDYAPPPNAYQLWSLDIGTTLPLHNISALCINFSITNLANTAYKDYMNRYRYYAHDIGRSFILRLAYNF